MLYQMFFRDFVHLSVKDICLNLFGNNYSTLLEGELFKFSSSFLGKWLSPGSPFKRESHLPKIEFWILIGSPFQRRRKWENQVE